MSKTVKIGLALFGTLIFLLVTLSILVKVVVTPEKVRDNLLPMAEKALQRKIDIGEIEIGIFSGVSLTDLRVQNRQTADDFISVQSLSLHYKLLPLLTGQLIIDQILLEEPRIEIVRAPDGQFNFSDLFANDGSSSSNGKSDSSQASGSSVFNLLINEVSVRGGALIFVDRSQSDKSPYRYIFDQFNFQASKISLETAFPIELSAELNGSKIALSGHYDIAKQTGDLDLQLSSLDLVRFAPYYRQALPGKLGAALLTLNLEAQLHPGAVESKGRVLLEQLDLVLNDLPDAALHKAKLGVDYAINYDLKKQNLDISTLFLNFNGLAFSSEGTIDLAGTEPQISLSVLFDQLDLRLLFENLPPGLTNELQSYSLAGQLDGRFVLAGQPKSGLKILKAADLELLDVKASVNNLRAGVSGKVHYADDQAESKQILLSVADQQMMIDFKTTNMTKEIIGGEFNITAERLDLNRLLPQPAAVQAQTGQKTTSVERQPTFADEIGPFDLPLDMTGRIKVGKLLYKKLELDQVQADLALKNNHLQIKQLRSGIAGGEFSASSDVDLGVKGLKYQGQMKLDQSNLLALVSGLVPQAEQSVSGLLHWQNNFSGRGTLPDNLLQSLQIKGLMQVKNGQIAGSPLLEQLAVFLGIPDLKILSFEALESRYDLRDGLANMSGLLNSSKAKLKPAGTIGVDGGLDVKLDARLAPDLMQKLGVKTGLKKTISDQDGWGILPLAIGGTLKRPKINFDAAALQKQAAGKVQEEATKRLLEEIAPEGGKEQEPVKQLLEGTLNRLFGN